jgi:hypothetical protein
MSTDDTAPIEPQLYQPDGEYDDWDDAPIMPRARTPWLTKLLTGALIAGVAFAGGVYAQKHWGSSSGSSTRSGSGAAARFGSGTAASTGSGSRRFGSGGFGGFGGSFAAAQGGSATSGQVSYVKGSTLYVAQLTGSTVKVSTTGARVTRTSTVTPAAIRPGDTVVIVGTKRANGTVAARSITVGGGVASLFGGQSNGNG